MMNQIRGRCSWFCFHRLGSKGYYVGDVDMNEAEKMGKQLLNVFYGLYHRRLRFEYWHRLQIPSTFHGNTTVMAFFMIRLLHDNSKYLEFNAQMIARQKLSLLGDFIQSHDQWLGKLRIDEITLHSHPFAVPEGSLKKRTGKNHQRVC